MLSENAASHAAGCRPCAEAVARARAFLAEIEGSLEASPNLPDLASRVIRIRPFSARERRDVRVWAGPVSFSVALLALGIGVLGAPGLAVRDQAGLSLALLAPAAALVRAGWRLAAEAFAASPDGWNALAAAARTQSTLGLGALLLLAPAGYALRRVLARAPRRS